jgi:hypothetical protein
MVSHYYELTGKSRQIVDCLETLYYIRKGIDPVRVNSIKNIAKKVLSFLLLVPVLPLKLLAHLVRVMTREGIPHETFEQERKKWNTIACWSQPELYHQTIIEKLIASRIDPGNYAKFLVVEYNGERGGGYFCGLDGLYRSQASELVRALEGHKKVLVCMKVEVSFLKHFYQQLPDYIKLKKHIADNLLEHPDVSFTQNDFQHRLDLGLEVLFFEHLNVIDFSRQLFLASCNRVSSYGH